PLLLSLTDVSTPLLSSPLLSLIGVSSPLLSLTDVSPPVLSSPVLFSSPLSSLLSPLSSLLKHLGRLMFINLGSRSFLGFFLLLLSPLSRFHIEHLTSVVHFTLY